MAEVADVLATYLASQGVGVVGTDLYIDWMPDAVDAVVSVYRVPGAGPSYFMDKSYPVNESRVQVMTRGAPLDYQGPRAKAATVAALLHPIVGQTVAGMRILAMVATDDPHLFERDAKERCTFTQYFEVTHET
jgi:hypothetical protein